MADPRLQTLTNRANTIHDEYRRNFAGRSRLTRDPAKLDALLAQLQQVAAEAGSVEGADTALIPQIREWETLYRAEATAIRDAKAAGPDVHAAWRLNDWGWLTFQRYRRGFSGQRRSTRDLGQLEEMVEDSRAWLAEFDKLAARHEAGWMADVRKSLANNLDMYSNECLEIAKARGGLPSAEQARVWASVANGQFAVWRRHFEGQQRRSRRMALLKRMIGSLRVVLAGMEAARVAGAIGASNIGNIERVRERIDFYERELEAVRKARATARPAELSASLGDEANGVFARYREQFAGKPRAAADPDALSDICEQLFAIARQMDDLVREYELEQDKQNVDIVIDNLKRYEREHIAIMEAKAGGRK